VGNHVATTLGYRIVDEEIIAHAASKGGVTPADVADEERRKSTLTKLLDGLGRGIAVDAVGIPLAGTSIDDPLPADAIRMLIVEAIEETAAQGDVVIVAHAAAHALTGRPDVLRVLVTASPDTRAERMADVRVLELQQAHRALKQSDAGRSEYLRRFYDVATELPTHYDLVINTDELSYEQAAELIVVAAR
jgi:threonine dehydrogenase-like Zn-dependent dehydrogenase